MRIERLDHLVLTVADIDTTVDFYERVLSMEHVENEGRHALKFGRQKINLHAAGHEFEPKAARPTPGSGDLCFITTQHPAAIARHFETAKIAVEEGPVPRTGALGPMRSFYIRDPDRNLIEIAVYEPTVATEEDS